MRKDRVRRSRPAKCMFLRIKFCCSAYIALRHWNGHCDMFPTKAFDLMDVSTWYSLLDEFGPTWGFKIPGLQARTQNQGLVEYSISRKYIKNIQTLVWLNATNQKWIGIFTVLSCSFNKICIFIDEKRMFWTKELWREEHILKLFQIRTHETSPGVANTLHTAWLPDFTSFGHWMHQIKKKWMETMPIRYNQVVFFVPDKLRKSRVPDGVPSYR